MEIRLQSIHTPFFDVTAFALTPGERLLIKGPSGTGKTTFLHLLAGLYRPVRGEVHWDNQSLAQLSETQVSQLRKAKMGLIFQNLNLLSYLSALENIELGGVNRALAQETLNHVGLGDKGHKLTQQMSLGEQQRVAVARVLAKKPEILLADEPTSSLDDKNAEQVMKLLVEGDTSQSLIMVSHDHRVEKFFSKIVSVEGILR